MKWKRETCSERRAKRAMWHRWWAWHKVDIGGGQMRRWHWLERREIIWKGYMTLDYGCPPFYGDWYIWEYREPELARSFDELRDLVDELERAGKS